MAPLSEVSNASCPTSEPTRRIPQTEEDESDPPGAMGKSEPTTRLTLGLLPAESRSSIWGPGIPVAASEWGSWPWMSGPPPAVPDAATPMGPTATLPQEFGDPVPASTRIGAPEALLEDEAHRECH